MSLAISLGRRSATFRAYLDISKTDKTLPSPIDSPNQQNALDSARHYFELVAQSMVKALAADVHGSFAGSNESSREVAQVAQLVDGAVLAWLSKVNGTPIETDVFKALFHDLFSRTQRHAQGEYYTPDWLAEYVLDRANYGGQSDFRIVDPMCGSGTFLVIAIKRLRQFCRLQNLSNADTLKCILANIVGMDRNPTAILAAKANYLLSIRDLRRLGENGSEIPIFGLDAIELGLNDDDLFAAGRDSIGRFDLVVGNPPWIGWETLPEAERRRTVPLWQRYGLFSHGGMATILGKGKKDLSTLLSYVATDRLLKDKGKLAFVITQSVFKTSAGEGFRRFRMGDGRDAIPMRVDSVDDMTDLQPFSGAGTRTAVVVWTKGEPTTYPIPYRIWQSIGSRKDMNDAGLETVLKRTRRLDYIARPLDADHPTSAWFSARSGCYEAIGTMLGKSDYRAYEGVNTGGANGILWVEKMEELPNGLVRIRNLPEAGKRPTRSIEAVVESDLLFPVLRGVEVRRWDARSKMFVLLVQDVQTRRGIDEATLLKDFPNTAAYLRIFEKELRARRMYERYFQRTNKAKRRTVETAPFHSMFNVGPYTLSPFKAVWHRMLAPIQAAVVGSQHGKTVLPQETHAFVPCESKIEACFVAGLLNSTLFNFAAMSAFEAGGKSFASPHLLERLRIPQFDPRNPNHIALAEVAMHRSRRVTLTDEGQIHDAELSLDSAAAAIWGLNDEQVRPIADCHAKLTKADLRTA